MARKELVQPVVTELPEAGEVQRRTAAYLGLLSEDLARAFTDAPSGIPLGPEVSAVVGDATLADLEQMGVPAALMPQQTVLERVASSALKVGLLSALVCAACNAVADGLGGMIASIPESLLLYGLVIPAAVTFVVACVGLPVALTAGIIAALRRRESSASLAQSRDNVAELSGRGVSGRAAEVDQQAVELARRTVRTPLPDSVEQDILLAIEEARRGLRQSDRPSDALLEAIAADLNTLSTALDSKRTRDFTAEDASAPLANLRRTARALGQGAV